MIASDPYSFLVLLVSCLVSNSAQSLLVLGDNFNINGHEIGKSYHFRAFQ